MSEPSFRKYVFVCENKRTDERPSCGAAGTRLIELLKDIVKSEQLGADVRVCRSGCLDVCEKGANVLIEPDHVMFHFVEDADLPKILACMQSGLKTT
jgi:(2Fe-2S) ferredoxin